MLLCQIPGFTLVTKQ